MNRIRWCRCFSAVVTSYARYSSHRANTFRTLQTVAAWSRQKSSWKFGVPLLCFSLPFFKNEDQKLKDEDPILYCIKRGILESRHGDYSKSNEYFHEALEHAHTKYKDGKLKDKDYKLIQINTFGRMGDSAMKFQDYLTAENIYKDCMKLCLEVGQREKDPSMIELSLKLASIYAATKQNDKAKQGFEFCLEASEERVKEEGGILKAETNTLALYGLTCHNFARYYMATMQNDKAIELYKKSQDVAEEVYGELHPQVLVVVNDLAAACVRSRKYTEGIKYYQVCIDRAHSMENMDETLIAFQYNMGEACILSSQFDKATASCTECLKIAKRLKKPEYEQLANSCLKDIEKIKEKTPAKTAESKK